MFSHDHSPCFFTYGQVIASGQDGQVLSEQISTEGPGRPQRPGKMRVFVHRKLYLKWDIDDG